MPYSCFERPSLPESMAMLVPSGGLSSTIRAYWSFRRDAVAEISDVSPDRL